MSDLPASYDPAGLESRLYAQWEAAGLFAPSGQGEEDELAPVLIVAPDTDTPLRPLLINLRDAAPDGAFERVLEVVPADPAARGPLRERWKHYQARGFALDKHDM